MDKEQLALLLLRLEQVEKAVNEIKRLLNGTEATDGLRWGVRQNTETLEQIRKIVAKLEAGATARALDDPRLRLFFYFVTIVLIATFLTVLLSSLGVF